MKRQNTISDFGMNARLKLKKIVMQVLAFTLIASALEASPGDCGMQGVCLTFDEAAARVFAKSPLLQISISEIQYKYGQKIQGGLLPNPIFSYTYEGGGDGKGCCDNGSESFFELTQPIELGGKRCYRVKTALYEYYAALAGYQASARILLNQMLVAFIEVVGAQENLNIAKEKLEIGKEVLATVSAKVDAGKASVIQLNKAKIELGSAEIDCHRARADLNIARQTLSLLWGCGCPDFDYVCYPFYSLDCPWSFEQCNANICCNPEVVQSQYEYLASRQNLNLEKAYSIPDLEVTVGYATGQGSFANGVILGAAIPIPIFDANQGNIYSARSQISRAYNEYRQTQLLLENKLTIAYQELIRAYNDAERLKSTVLKAAYESFEFAREGYQEGKFEYLDMLDSQRTLFDVKGTYIQSLMTYHQRRADIEYLNTQVD